MRRLSKSAGVLTLLVLAMRDTCVCGAVPGGQHHFLMCARSSNGAASQRDPSSSSRRHLRPRRPLAGQMKRLPRARPGPSEAGRPSPQQVVLDEGHSAAQALQPDVDTF